MAEYADREHFIPIRVADLVEFLCEESGPLFGQKLSPDERTLFRDFARTVTGHIHHVYQSELRILKDAYAPFDPDADPKPLKTLSAAERGVCLDLLSGLTAEVNHWPEEPDVDRDDRGPIPRVNVSVKLSALFSQFDPIDPEGTSRVVCSRLRPILRLAKQAGAFVNLDMEQHSFKDTTLKIFRDVLTEPEFQIGRAHV